MREIRVLTDKGIDLFIEYILEAKAGPTQHTPVDKLSRMPWSTEFSPHIEIDALSVKTRMELGQYLVDLFESNNVDRKHIVNSRGMWSWLVLVWFDVLCPRAADGSRKVRESPRYVCSSDYTDYYRHLVASTWDIYDVHRGYSRLFLWTGLDIHNDFIEQLASRQNIISNKALIECFDRLYWNEKLGHPKAGAQNRKKDGNFRRLVAFVSQVDLTYDLNAMSADDILALLPAEFDPWKAA